MIRFSGYAKAIHPCPDLRSILSLHMVPALHPDGRCAVPIDYQKNKT